MASRHSILLLVAILSFAACQGASAQIAFGPTGGLHLGTWTRLELGAAIASAAGCESVAYQALKASAIVKPEHGVVGGEIGWWGESLVCLGLNLGCFTNFDRAVAVFRLEIGLGLAQYRIVYGWNAYKSPPLMSGINSSELFRCWFIFR